MSGGSLIEKLEAAKADESERDFNSGLQKAIAIVRQHEAAQEGPRPPSNRIVQTECHACHAITHSVIDVSDLLDAPLADGAEQPIQYGYDPGTKDGDVPALVFRKGDEMTAVLTGNDARVVAEFIPDLAEASPDQESVDFGSLAAHVASALGAMKGSAHGEIAGAKNLEYVLNELMKLYEQQRRG